MESYSIRFVKNFLLAKRNNKCFKKLFTKELISTASLLTSFSKDVSWKLSENWFVVSKHCQGDLKEFF